MKKLLLGFVLGLLVVLLAVIARHPEAVEDVLRNVS